MVRLFLRRLVTGLRARLGLDAVRYQGQVLPPRELRFGGPHFKDHGRFLESALGEAERLAERCGLGPESRVLDVGCGPGRLAVGLQARGKPVGAYRGVDVEKTSVEWCRRHLEPRDPAFRFFHIDLANARYNPRGGAIPEDFRFPVDLPAFDVIYLYSVFSHMLTEDVRIYLREMRRILAPGGHVFLTGFFEEGVPECEENPADYRMEWKGPLHCVRFDKAFFQSLAAEQGLTVAGFDYEAETDGQSGVYLVPSDDPASSV